MFLFILLFYVIPVLLNRKLMQVTARKNDETLDETDVFMCIFPFVNIVNIFLCLTRLLDGRYDLISKFFFGRGEDEK